MFRTFRLRLLFWFLVFISSSFVIIILSLTYLQKREEIFAQSEAIDQAYLLLLKSVQTQQNFFSYETKNGDYFLTGQSSYLDEYKVLLDSTLSMLSQADFKTEPNLQQVAIQQQASIRKIDSLFVYLTTQIKARGFKDYSLEGQMRDAAHWLEEATEVPTENVLSLRRHEKDYIIRNETQYVEKFSAAITEIERSVRSNRSIPADRRQTILAYLNSYKELFLRLVQLDREIGIKDNSGLKLTLDQEIKELEAGFGSLVQQTRNWARKEFDELTLYFGITVVLLVLISIVISAFIAHKITQPLRELTTHITRFVDSNFTLEKEHPVVRSKDEIGSLTKNFSILKNEVISQMRFFKQRVEERTEELATANKRLARLSEANSRFVPKEFLQNLGRTSIEEVNLGDQVAREMTVVFTDIRSFTQISEALSPQENFDFLNRYLGGIVPIIEKHGGFIDKFIGDSVMALFPNSPDHALNAVLEFEAFINEFNQQLKEHWNMDPIYIGSGIHTGSLILGTIGHDNRLETTVISDAVNTAARVEGLTKYYHAPVVATEETLNRLDNKEAFHYRFLDKVQVKGKTTTLSVYEFLSANDTLKIRLLNDYNQAIEHLRANEIPEAMEVFQQLRKQHPKDKAVKRFIDKYKNYQPGDSPSWGEVTQMTKK